LRYLLPVVDGSGLAAPLNAELHTTDSTVAREDGTTPPPGVWKEGEGKAAGGKAVEKPWWE
jgi:hypothetical protein